MPIRDAEMVTDSVQHLEMFVLWVDMEVNQCTRRLARVQCKREASLNALEQLGFLVRRWAPCAEAHSTSNSADERATEQDDKMMLLPGKILHNIDYAKLGESWLIPRISIMQTWHPRNVAPGPSCQDSHFV